MFLFSPHFLVPTQSIQYFLRSLVWVNPIHIHPRIQSTISLVYPIQSNPVYNKSNRVSNPVCPFHICGVSFPSTMHRCIVYPDPVFIHSIEFPYTDPTRLDPPRDDPLARKLIRSNIDVVCTALNP